VRIFAQQADGKIGKHTNETQGSGKRVVEDCDKSDGKLPPINL